MNPILFRLKARREAAGLTQAQLAAAVGVTQPCLVYIEQGKKFPSWSTACKLADMLGISLDEFRRDRANPS